LTRKLPSSIPYGALLKYSPYGKSDVSQHSRNVCTAIKSGRDATVHQAVERLVQRWQDAGMVDYFGDDVVLVPMPRSSLLVEDALWPSMVLCREIVRQGLAQSVEPALRRVTAVPKAHYGKAADRPDVEKHLATMEANPWLFDGTRITVVDDVVTKGVQLYASHVLVQEAMPDAEVRVFALIRTIGFDDVEKIVDPVTGTLTRYPSGKVWREP
jgi:hypothetical protein